MESDMEAWKLSDRRGNSAFRVWGIGPRAWGSGFRVSGGWGYGV